MPRGYRSRARTAHAPRNMAAHAEEVRVESRSHIREIGPHAHDWRTARHDGPIAYQQCQNCGTRRASGGQPSAEGAQWIAGGGWPNA